MQINGVFFVMLWYNVFNGVLHITLFHAEGIFLYMQAGKNINLLHFFYGAYTMKNKQKQHNQGITCTWTEEESGLWHVYDDENNFIAIVYDVKIIDDVHYYDAYKVNRPHVDIKFAEMHCWQSVTNAVHAL